MNSRVRLATQTLSASATHIGHDCDDANASKPIARKFVGSRFEIFQRARSHHGINDAGLDSSSELAGAGVGSWATGGRAAAATAMAFAGLVATAVGDLIMAPIDTIKTVQQAASGSSAALSMVGASRLLMQRAPPLPPARGGPCPPVPPRPRLSIALYAAPQPLCLPLPLRLSFP